MSIQGQPKCQRCGGAIGLTCVCKPIRIIGKVHGSGRIEGPIEISEKGRGWRNVSADMQSDPLPDPDSGLFYFIIGLLVVTAIGAGFLLVWEFAL